jgi:hypothetical protein
VFTYILFVAAAAANPTAVAGQDATEPPAKKEERIVCKSKKFVGSNLSQRICKTESEWRAGREDAQRALDDRGRGGNYTLPTGPN